MKKIIYLSFMLTIISTAASGQRISRVPVRTQIFISEKITRPERFQFRRNIIRLNIVQHNTRRDGVVTPVEKRRIHKAKNKIRRDGIFFRRSRHS